MLLCKIKNDLFSHWCLLMCYYSSPVHRFNKSVMYLLSLSLHHNICTALHYCCAYRQINAVLLFPALWKQAIISCQLFFFFVSSCGREIDLTDEDVSLFNMTSNQHFNCSWMRFYFYRFSSCHTFAEAKQTCCRSIRGVVFLQNWRNLQNLPAFLWKTFHKFKEFWNFIPQKI